MKTSLKKFGLVLFAFAFLLMVIVATNYTAIAASEIPAEDTPVVTSETADDEYLSIYLRGREGNKWIIYLGGPNPYSSWSGGYQYNSKMCYTNDAKEWSGLSNVVTVKKGEGTIPGYTGQEIKIESNFFADAVAFCYEDNYTRYITYANHLFVDRDGQYSMDVYHNTKAV